MTGRMMMVALARGSWRRIGRELPGKRMMRAVMPPSAQARLVISTTMAAMTMPGAGTLPESQSFAARSDVPPSFASTNAVL
jgi:hypothetical protein